MVPTLKSWLPRAQPGVRACVISHFICVRFFAALWIVACLVPLSIRFSRQEYWGGLLCPPPRDLPYPGIKPTSLASPALFTTCAPWEAPSLVHSPTEQLASQKRNPGSPIPHLLQERSSSRSSICIRLWVGNVGH